jgi:hypothetical protein
VLLGLRVCRKTRNNNISIAFGSKRAMDKNRKALHEFPEDIAQEEKKWNRDTPTNK